MTAPHIHPARMILSAEEAAHSGALKNPRDGVRGHRDAPRPGEKYSGEKCSGETRLSKIHSIDKAVWGLNPEVVKPEWESFPPVQYSNTAGAGSAYLPGWEDKRRIDRARSNTLGAPRMLDQSGIARFTRRAENVWRSPGCFAVSFGALILIIGLSPLVANEQPTPQNSAPPAISTLHAGDTPNAQH